LLTLKLLVRCGFSPYPRQIRPTLEPETPISRAILLRDQCVAPAGFDCVVLANTRAIISGEIELLQPMVEAIEDLSGQRPGELLADAGYRSDSNLQYLESEAEPEKQIDAYVATVRQKHSEVPAACPRVDRMRRKLKAKVGAAIYGPRCASRTTF
jgi:hypothetical protein